MTTITIHRKIGPITNTINKTSIHINSILTCSNIVINIDLSKNSRAFYQDFIYCRTCWYLILILIEVQDLHLHSYVLALDTTTNRNTNMDTHLVNNITYIIQNGYIHATNTVSHGNPAHYNTHTNTSNTIHINTAVKTFILTMQILPTVEKLLIPFILDIILTLLVLLIIRA